MSFLERTDSPPHASPTAIQEMRRGIALLMLVHETGTVTRSEVDNLAGQLYLDAKDGRQRPLAESWNLIRTPDRPYLAGSPLSHVGVVYDTSEMEQQGELLAVPDAPPRSPADTIAGNGKQRPVVLDLLGLCDRQLLAPVGQQSPYDVFQPTNRGVAIARSLTTLVRKHHSGMILAQG